MKPLKDIKFGQRVLDVIPENELVFVQDVQRRSGFDAKTVKRVLAQLLKNGYLAINERSQWYRNYE